MSAVISGSLEMVRLLIERGADVNGCCTIPPPMTALSHAIFYGHTEIADLLRAHGAVLPDVLGFQEPTTRDLFVRHVENHLGPVNPQTFTEIVPGEVAVWIHAVPPGQKQSHLTLFTTGMSDLSMQTPPDMEEFKYAELVIHLPGDWPLTLEALADRQYGWPIEWLRLAAHYPPENRTWIGPGAGMMINGDPAEPLTPGLPFDSLLMLSEESSFGQFRLPDNRLICFYILVPVYPAERRLRQTEGIPRLIERLQEMRISRVVNPHRPNVCE